MTDSIEHYLDQLRSHLAGADPATIQDALSDAEDHLRAAVSQTLGERPEETEASAVRSAVDAFGSPADVAAAYREIEARVPPPLMTRPLAPTAGTLRRSERSWVAGFFGVFVDPRAYAALFYMLFSLITGIMYFTWAMTGVSLSFGLIVLVIGLPFVLAFLLSIQGIALVEGRIVEALLGVRMPRRPIFSRSHLGFWGRLRALATDKLSWTTLCYMVAQLPLGVVYFSVFLTMLAFALSGIAYPLMSLFVDIPYLQFNDWQVYPPAWFHPLLVIVGVLWILVTLHLARIVGRAHGGFAKLMLVRD